MAYKQKNNPFAVTSCGRRRNYMTVGNSSPVKIVGGFEDHKKNAESKNPNTVYVMGSYTHHVKHNHPHDKNTPVKMVAESPVQKRKRKRKPDVRKTTKGKNRNFRTTKEGAGMTKKGVASYRRKNPGSKLKTAVTGKVKRGSKAAKRRKSFCARSRGWKGPRGRAARRRWRC